MQTVLFKLQDYLVLGNLFLKICDGKIFVNYLVNKGLSLSLSENKKN